MVRFSTEVWFLLAAIGGGCALAFLYYLAVSIENERRVRDLHEKSAKLRRRYSAQLRGETAGEPDVVAVIEVGEAPPPSIPMPPPDAAPAKQAA